MNQTELILAKNDIEGLASSILLNTTILPNPDINFCKYEYSDIILLLSAKL